MKSVDQKQIHKLRKRHNHDILKRMRDGDPLKGFDSFSSWFPPRPIVKKDQKAIAKLYGKESASTTGENLPNKDIGDDRQNASSLTLLDHDHIA